MKARIILLSILIALLLLITSSQAGADRLYTIDPGTASDRGYRLTGQEWRVSGVISGRGYRLQGPASPNIDYLCCCTYLPCIPRNN